MKNYQLLKYSRKNLLNLIKLKVCQNLIGNNSSEDEIPLIVDNVTQVKLIYIAVSIRIAKRIKVKFNWTGLVRDVEQIIYLSSSLSYPPHFAF